MGALHEGHRELVRRARAECDRVVVSIFVNPAQFGPNEDYGRYPRQLEADCDLCAAEGVDAVYAPELHDVYPDGFSTAIDPGEIASEWEGAFRPGHFRGVVTVVGKLFNTVLPTIAYFGWKDLQQCLVVTRMVRDLDFRVRLEFVDTVREVDGLALSSRNAYLEANARLIAPRLYSELKRSGEAIEAGGNVQEELDQSRLVLRDAGFDIDYFAYVDMKSLESLDTMLLPSAVIAAVRLGSTRLIDNYRLHRQA